MPIIGIRDLARRASELVEQVEGGEHVLVTRHGRPVAALVAVDAEALEDFILAHSPEYVASMRQADEELARGETRALSAVLRDIRGEPVEGTWRLTPRQLEVLALLASGKSSSEIADRLELRPETVQRHLREMLGKLGVRERLEEVRERLAEREKDLA